MNVILSPAGTVDPIRPGQGIGDIAAAGFTNISLDMNLYCTVHELERYGKKSNAVLTALEGAMEESSKESAGASEDSADQSLLAGLDCFQQFLSKCRDNDLHIPVARGFSLSRDTKRTDLHDLLFGLNAEGIALCGNIGCRYIVIRPLFSGIEKGEMWERNRDYYLRLAYIARKHKVTILLENQCRCIGGHMVRGICADGNEAARWVDVLNEAAGEDRFGFCMDVGVCSLCGQDMHEFALALRERMKVVILRDCDGSRESSLLPFTSVCNGQAQTDWLNLLRGLREIGFDGQLFLDMEDTAGAFSPLLRPQLLQLARWVAEYFKCQIEIEQKLKRYSAIVLFGAGNMCRNFIKCYGEKYAPLFTCDNNQVLWGTSFCGLEVKPPEALRSLPEGCAILICNIYYREIEKQLRQMGVGNPIEFFNDEYMPSFYFDRLDTR